MRSNRYWYPCVQQGPAIYTPWFRAAVLPVTCSVKKKKEKQTKQPPKIINTTTSLKNNNRCSPQSHLPLPKAAGGARALRAGARVRAWLVPGRERSSTGPPQVRPAGEARQGSSCRWGPPSPAPAPLWLSNRRVGLGKGPAQGCSARLPPGTRFLLVPGCAAREGKAPSFVPRAVPGLRSAGRRGEPRGPQQRLSSPGPEGSSHQLLRGKCCRCWNGGEAGPGPQRVGGRLPILEAARAGGAEPGAGSRGRTGQEGRAMPREMSEPAGYRRAGWEQPLGERPACLPASPGSSRLAPGASSQKPGAGREALEMHSLSPAHRRPGEGSCVGKAQPQRTCTRAHITTRRAQASSFPAEQAEEGRDTGWGRGQASAGLYHTWQAWAGQRGRAQLSLVPE